MDNEHLAHIQFAGVVFFFRTTHLKWNQYAHRSHSISFESKDSGILHVQKRLITMCETLLLLGFAEGEVDCGNSVSAEFCKHSSRCCLIKLCSYQIVLKFFLITTLRAKAFANKPQSVPPLCWCTKTTKDSSRANGE